MHGKQMILKGKTKLAEEAMAETKQKAKEAIDKARSIVCITNYGTAASCISAINPADIPYIMDLMKSWNEGYKDSMAKIDKMMDEEGGFDSSTGEHPFVV